MGREEILDKMRELRDARDNELMDKNKDNMKVTDVKYLGTIDYNGEKKQIFLLEEQVEKEDGETINIERYYTEDGEFLGGNNNADQYDYIILDEKHLNEKELLEDLEELDKSGELDLNKLEDEWLDEIALTLGIDKEHIKAMSEIDADELIKLKEEEKETEDKTNRNNDKTNKETISKKQMDKVSTKTEISTSQKVTDNETMSQLLKVSDKGYKKIAIIDTDNFRDSTNTTRFSIVGIKEDGTAERIDTLEQGYGVTPTKQVNAVNRDGTKVEKQQVNSIFKIKGEKEKQISVKIGAMGTIETNLVRTPSQDNSEAISIPIETHSIRPTTRETRELMNDRRNPRVKEEIERINEHRELGCEDVKVKDIDDNLNNDTHIHLHEEEIDELARKILEQNDEIADLYNREDVKVKIQKELKANNKDMNIEKLQENVEKQMKENAESEHETPRT